MRKFLFGLAAVSSLASSALAADLGRPYPIIPRGPEPIYLPAPAPTPQFSGRYVGAFGLYGEGSVGQEGTGFRQAYGANGWGGGLTAGYDWQLGRLVAGLNASVAWTDMRGSLAHTPFGFPTVDSARLASLTTLGGRAGLAFGRLFAFGQAGGAYGVVASRSAFDLGGLYDSHQRQRASGHYWGGGLEYRFADAWSASIDYKRFDLDVASFSDNAGFHSRQRFDADMTALGLNFRF